MDLITPVFISKVVSALGIFAFSVIFGVAPLFCKRCVKWKKVQWANNGIISFSGGTLLGISFLHLMPETRRAVAKLYAEGHFKSFPIHVSLADTVICGGFFFIYVFDELVHLLLQCAGVGHYHQPHGLRDADHEVFNFVQGGGVQKTIESKEDGRKETKDEATSTEEGGNTSSLSHLHPRIHIPSILTIIALSFHDIFEGLALGIQGHVDDVLFLFLSIATHKYAIAFSVSLDLLLSGVDDCMIFLYTLCFSVVNPVGICLGIASGIIGQEENVETPVTVLMQGLASGSLIYVTCFEVLQRHTSSSDHVSGIRNTMFVITGFIFILIMKIYLPHDHIFFEPHKHHG